MTVTAIFTNKGGVGKTTISCNLANTLARTGRRVLVIDCDPQANASGLLLGPHAHLKAITSDHITDMTDILRPVLAGNGNIRNLAPAKSADFGVHVIASSPGLALSEDFLGADWTSARSGEYRGIATTLFLKRAIGLVREKYDDILIDCNPGFGPLTRAALLASDDILVPVAVDQFSVMAMTSMSTWLARFDKQVRDLTRLAERGASEIIPEIGQPARVIGLVRSSLRPEHLDDTLVAGRLWSEAGKLTGVDRAEPLANIPWAPAPTHMAAARSLPIAALNADHGLVGSQYMARQKTVEAFENLAVTLLEGRIPKRPEADGLPTP